MQKKKSAAKTDYTQKAYMGIRRMFFVNEIIPGQKISYRDLAERLNMSPTPIIQALKHLEFQGLVRHEPNRGFYTAEISLKEIGEIYDLRELIEVSLIETTTKIITKRGITKLEKALNEHITAVRDIYIKDRLLKDMEFHITLASLSKCGVQIQTLKNLFDLLYLKYRGSVLFVTPMETVDNEHQKIFEYIVDKNVEKAGEILGQHILNVKKHALASTQKMLDSKKEFKLF